MALMYECAGLTELDRLVAQVLSSPPRPKRAVIKSFNHMSTIATDQPITSEPQPTPGMHFGE